MAFLDKNGLQVLTNKLVQGDAIKVASHRGHTIKNVIDNITRECENVETPNIMTLENRVKEFKVGRGRDVDASGDVEEGKIEVELQGKTYQNLLGGLKGTPSGVNATNTVVDNGDKTITITRGAESTNTHVGVYFDLNKSCLKENQTYTIIINVIENTLPNGMYLVDSSYTGFTPSKTISLKQTGTIRHSITYTGANADRWWIWTFRDTKSGKVTFSYPILLEGDHTQTPVEELPKYFEGIKSSFDDGVIDVEVQGKNLFNFEDVDIWSSTAVTYSQIENDFKITSNSNSPAFARISIKYPAKLFAGKNLTLSCKATKTVNSTSPSVQIYYRNENDKAIYIGFWNKQITHTFPKKILTDFVELGLYTNNTNTAGIVNTINVSEIAATEVSSKISYEPYYKKRISLNIGESLRNLPNGICDEIRNNNGQWELVRRVGKVILDGSSGNWGTSRITPQEKTLIFQGDAISQLVKPKSLANSDKFATYTGATTDEEGILPFSGTGNTRIYFRINKSKLITQDVEGFKQWLSQNPTTVYYELAKPIITSIEPIKFEVKPLSTIIINSDIAPVSNHKVVLNRAGQIEQGIVQIAELKSRVDSLETAYNSYLLETQHKLSLLGFEYELESEEI